MSLTELFFISISLSMDAFAVSISEGLSMRRFTICRAMKIGAYFGLFQAIMPVIGNAVATLFSEQIIVFDHWIAFILLCFLGIKMIIGSRRESEPLEKESLKEAYSSEINSKTKRQAHEEGSVSLAHMLPLSIATSIDALAVGVSFAFLHVNIFVATSIIGAITFLVSVLGVKVGSVFGLSFKSKAELGGGIILIIIAIKILFEHTLII